MPERHGASSHQPTIASPCIRNCCLDENDICLGCYRSLAEICVWGESSDTQRRQILEQATQRKQQRLHDQPETT